MASHQALERLLLSLFSADELRRWIRYLPGGEVVTSQLPGAHASPAMLASEAVAVLDRSGMLDQGFWERLIAERPRRQKDIEPVRAMFAVVEAPKGPEPKPTVDATVKTVLLVSASPERAVRLRVDREFRDIIERMRSSPRRDQFRFEQLGAARFDDLRTALLQHKPYVLHISAHGKEDGSLVLEGKADEHHVVTKLQLHRLLKALRGNLKLVVINACHSRATAQELTEVVDLTIGMDDEVADEAAISFSVPFYESSLGFGETIEAAFDGAVAGLDVIDDKIPLLFPPADRDPDNKRKTII